MTAAREDVRAARPYAPPSPGYRDPVMWVTVTAVFAAYTVIAVSRYAQDSPASWDLGIFTEAVRQYAHLHAPVVAVRGAGFDLLGDHFHPALALLGPVFRVFPTPVTLLVAQAALTAISVVPVTRAGVALLGGGPGRVIGAAYGFSWGLASMNWYDFHEVALAVPLLAFGLSALARGRVVAATWWLLPLVFVKEDQGFTVAATGLVMVFAYRARLAGVLLGAWGLVWSFAAIYLIIPQFNPSHQYPYWDKGAHLTSIAANFASGAGVKLSTLALILLPTAGVALRSPLAAVAVPGLLLRFVSTDTSYWGTSWHYNATVMPVVFVAAIDGLSRIRAARIRAATRGGAAGAGAVRAGAAGAGAVGVGAVRVGAVRAVAGWANPASGLLGGYAAAMMAVAAIGLAVKFPLQNLWNAQTYVISHHERVADAAMRMVPTGATVEASLNELAPLAARDETYWVGNRNPPPQWIVFDQRSPEWLISDVPGFVRSKHAGIVYRVVSSDDGVWVLRQS